MTLELWKGRQAPDFTLPTTMGTLSLADLIAQGKVVLSFYAEDATPVCTAQINAFKEGYETMVEFGAQLLAISADSLESHQAFAKRIGGVPFPLASDEQLEVSTLYGVVDEVSKRSRRAVFVVDEYGMLLLANPSYNPGNPAQYASVFKSLGIEV